ncbi:substrate-binding periplasmic protein [Shewanella jiangmenensis]|uniref:substrate-binding periplasmic protein n=1 Tax=Shewanella jiangmenensis TaxID=2837387 RepID=UPI0032D8D3FA
MASLVAMLAGAQAQADCAHVLHVAYNDWPPYSWSEGDGEPQGLDVELMQTFAAKAGCELVFDKMPAKRSHQLLRVGKVDIMMGASKTDDREAYAVFSSPYRQEVVGVFSLDSQKLGDIVSWTQLMNSGLRLLVPQAGWYGSDYEASRSELEHKNLLVESPDLLRSVQMLARNRAELALGDSLSLPYIASQTEHLHLYRHTARLSESDIHLMFSKAAMSEAEASSIERAIVAAHQSGDIAALLLKWEQISLSRINFAEDSEARLGRSTPQFAD